ncbi:MAG: hypothetical protein SOW71_04430 [Eubacteriales bacterium]|nr:hypothetical protein [Eubacteriales bacterium]
MSLSKTFREAFDGFGWELLEGIRAKANERISDAEFEERIIGIEKATAAMLEAEVDEETIIKMLQKHWDLRLSEATAFIENAKS